MTSPYAQPRYDLPGSLFLIFTASTNHGKTYQISGLIEAKAPDGRPAVMPTLYLWCEASTEGTAGHILADESVVAWGVRDLDEAIHALKTCFPEGRGPLTLSEARKAYLASDSATRAKHAGARVPEGARSPMDHWPLRSLAVDSASTLLAGQKTKIREGARDDRQTKAGGNVAARFTHKRDAAALDLDEKRIAGIAYGPATDFADIVSGICTRHRGTLAVIAVHTTSALQAVTVGEGNKQEVKEIAVGVTPDFGAPKSVKPGMQLDAYAKIWNNLAAKANLIWHLYRKLPDHTGDDLAAINARGQGRGVTFGAITEAGIFPSPVGAIGWAKRQGGPGWLGWFDDATPPMWHPHVPWLGEDDTDLQAEFTARALTLPSGRDADGNPRYRTGPHAGLLLELCLADHAARKDGP
jgi:hypothetical protein